MSDNSEIFNSPSWIEDTFELMELYMPEQRQNFDNLRRLAKKKRKTKVYTTLLTQNSITELQK